MRFIPRKEAIKRLLPDDPAAQSGELEAYVFCYGKQLLVIEDQDIPDSDRQEFAGDMFWTKRDIDIHFPWVGERFEELNEQEGGS